MTTTCQQTPKAQRTADDLSAYEPHKPPFWAKPGEAKESPRRTQIIERGRLIFAKLPKDERARLTAAFDDHGEMLHHVGKSRMHYLQFVSGHVVVEDVGAGAVRGRLTTRRDALVQLLRDGPRSSYEIADALGWTRDVAKHQTRAAKAAGIIEVTKNRRKWRLVE